MARLLEVKPATGKTYTVELNQDEYDVISGILSDILDKRVVMDYVIDENRAVPTRRGWEAIKSAHSAIEGNMDPDYDYYDFWQEGEVDLLEDFT